MTQYINKDILVAEIDKRLEELWTSLPSALDVIEDKHTKEEANITGKYTALESFKNFIDTIEVKEVDLEIEQRVKECPYRRVECTMYEGKILKCDGACSWVVDYPKLKELKAQKRE